MLVDTDVLIWYLRGHERVRQFLQSAGRFTILAITNIELIQGMRDARELSALRRFLKIQRVPVLALAGSISNWALIYMEEYFLSHSLQLADALIAELELVPFSPVDG